MATISLGTMSKRILAGTTVVRELVQHDCQPAAIASEMTALLVSPRTREELEARLAEVVSSLGEGGAYRRAAAAVAEELSREASA